jgi:NAD+-dependent farnesol dehydrogenase
MQPTTVFLTGGTGYLGGELLRQLTAAGHSVRVLVRNRSTTLPAGVERAEGDLSDAGRLAAQIRGCGAVFHAAALVSSWAPDRGEFFRTNVEGVRNVMRAAGQAGAPVVYTSSFFALGPAGPPGAREDSFPAVPPRHPYARTKLQARMEARKALAAGSPIVILYPGVIYGPGRGTAGNIVGRLVTDFVHGRIPGLLGEGTQVWSFAFVEDVARAHISALERASAGGEYVLGGDNVALRDFFGTLSRLTGKPAPRLHVPKAVGALAGAVEYASARLRGRIPGATPSTVLMMYQNWACDSARARAEIGYSFRPLRAGLLSTLESMGIPAVKGSEG